MTRPPRSTGILRALWDLSRPPAFEPRPPHVEGELFHRRPVRGIAPRVDVYLPDGSGPHPSVLLLHGGGFVIGSRRMKPVRYLATRLAGAGVAAAAIDYRLVFRGGRLDESLADVADAAEWWTAQTERFAIDPGRVSIAGFSAGATLALLHAATADPGRYHRLVSFFGLYDFDWLDGRLARLMRRLLLRSGDPAVWKARSPMASSHVPTPLLLVHGTADTLVPIEQARRLHERRRGQGLPTRLCVYEGAAHGFLNDAELPETRAAADEALAFLVG